MSKRVLRGEGGQEKSQGSGSLTLESLESRVLLTTITLPRDATGPTQFWYADPEGAEAGAAENLNVITVGTLSGLPPEKDVVIEIFNYQGEDIAGYLDISGQSRVNILGGPGGGSIIEEVPPDQLGGISFSVHALATAPDGTIYGITQGGLLITIDGGSGDLLRVLGTLADTDNAARGAEPLLAGADFTQFESAAFDPITGELYAVVVGPTAFDAAGNVTSTGEVLITIDPEPTADGLIEVEASGRNAQGLASYSFSEVTLGGGLLLGDDITTIAYQGRTPQGEPVFMGFDVQGGDTGNSFVQISLVRPEVGQTATVTTQFRASAGDELVQGLLYDASGDLWALHNGMADDGALALVDFNRPVDERFPYEVEFGDRPDPDDNAVWLSGMTYDSLNGVGYATDPRTGTLYSLNVDGLEVVEDDLVPTTGWGDIYTMWIASSTPDVYITISWYDNTPQPWKPTEGDVAPLFVDEDNALIETPEEAGGVMIGTVPQIVNNNQLRWSPGSFSTVATFFDSDELGPNPGTTGAYPGGALRPGIFLPTTSPEFLAPGEAAGEPQHIGRLQIDGGVFGDVNISGSMDTFYAGYLGTNEFRVEGDLNQLVVHTQAGGRTEDDDSWTSAGSAFYGGTGISPVLEVGGRLGSYYSQGDWGLPIVVHGSSFAPQFPGVFDPVASGYYMNGEITSYEYTQVYREIERKFDNVNNSVLFRFGALDVEGGWILTNDTPWEAQMIGSPTGTVEIIGELESSGSWDPEDWYSFSLMAGETVELELFSTMGWMDVITGNPLIPASDEIWDLTDRGLVLFGPGHEWVASRGDVDPQTGAALSIVYTAEVSGIYTVGVNTRRNSVGSSSLVGGAFPYRLEVSGLSSTVLGGGNMLADMRSQWGPSGITVPQTDVQVASGNLGALSVGQVARSARVNVVNGDLGAWRAGANALAPYDLNLRREMDAPEGSEVGFGFEWSDAPNNVSIVGSVVTGGSVGEIHSPLRSALDVFAGEDIHSVRIGGDIGAEDEDAQTFSGYIVADENIGVVRISGGYGYGLQGDDGTNWVGLTAGIFANADGEGDGGIIDAVIVGGSWGSSVGGGSTTPLSVGERGGNVRFVYVGGSVFWSTGAIGTTLGPYEYDPGQGVRIVDDSGAVVRIAPGYSGQQTELVLDPFADPGRFDDDDELDEGDGGVLTIKVVPVWDQTFEHFLANGTILNRSALGYAIAHIDSTDGLRVRSYGGPVEIGLVTAAGINDDEIIFSGDSPISVLRIEAESPLAAGDGGAGGGGQDEEEDEPIGISRIVNSTVGGDLVSVLIGDIEASRNITAGDPEDPGDEVGDEFDVGEGEIEFDFGEDEDEEETFAFVQIISVRGNLGLTSSNTGQLVHGLLMTPADVSVMADAGGLQRAGLYSDAPVNLITVAGAMADVDVRADVGRIVINDDNTDAPGQFDGVVGPIMVYGNLSSIELGDGIGDPGTGWWAQNGVYVVGRLERANISGDGNDIQGPLFATLGMGSVDVSNGARILGYSHQALAFERVGPSFSNPTVSTTVSFNDWFLYDSSFGAGLGIDRLVVRGEGSEIRDTLIRASSFGQFQVVGGAAGVFGSIITAVGTVSPDTGSFRQITIGGEGLHESFIHAGRDLGKLTVLPGGTIEDSIIRGIENLGTIQADEINRTDIDTPNRIERIMARDGIYDLVVEAGGLSKLQSGGDMLGSAIYIAGPLGIMNVRGDLISTIEVTGPNGDVGKIIAGGDIGTPAGGSIIVDGTIGMIKAGGDFYTDQLQLNWQPTNNAAGGYRKYDLDGPVLGKLMAKGQVIGAGNIGGDVKSIISSGEFGEFGEFGEELTIHGNLGMLRIGSGRTLGDLESSLTVTESLGRVMVFGDVNGQIEVTDDFRMLTLKGKPTDPVFLNASITVGGDFGRGVIVNGGIAATDVVDGGPVTLDVAGSSGGIVIRGRVAAPQAPMMAAGAPAAAAMPMAASATAPVVETAAFEAPAALMSLAAAPAETTQFELTEPVMALAAAAGDIDGTVRVGASELQAQSQRLEIPGSILATGRYIVEGDARTIHIGGDIEPGGVLEIRGDVDQLIVDGTIAGVVHVTGSIGQVTAGNIVGAGALVTAGEDIGRVRVAGLVQDSFVLAGFEPGAVLDGGNQVIDRQTLLTGGTAGQGDLGRADIGILDNSTLAAGLHPGGNGVYGDMDGTEVPGPGQSSVGAVRIGAIAGDGSPFGVFADTAVRSIIVGGQRMTGTVSPLDNGFRSWAVSESFRPDLDGFIFEQGQPFRGVVGGVPVTVVMSGPGVGQLLPGNDGIESLQLTGTTSRTRVKVTAAGRDTVDVREIFTSGDSDLGMLQIDGRLAGDDAVMWVDGDLGRLQMNGIGAGSTIEVHGGMSRADLGTVLGSSAAPTTMTVTGDISRLQLDAIAAFATISGANLDRVQVGGNLAGAIEATSDEEGIGKVQVQGNMPGTISSAADIDQVTVRGTMGQLALRETQGIRAARDIGRFTANEMIMSVVAAGRNFDQASIRSDMRQSTLAAGLDIGPSAVLYDFDETTVEDPDRDAAGRGELAKVTIGGDLVESNLIAALTPGQDGQFATGDDQLEARNVEDLNPPGITNVSFAGTNMNEIKIEFSQGGAAKNGRIGSVVVRGTVSNGIGSSQQYAIAAAGQVRNVVIDGEQFVGSDQTVRRELNDREIDGNTITIDDITASNAAGQAVQIWAIGLDQEFGTADDYLVTGDDDPNTQAQVWVSWDAATNTATLHNRNGFAENLWATNYYQLVIDGTAVTNRQGVALDGEFDGTLPTGDGVPGGDFVYNFAVADLGDTIATAFSPFADAFPKNMFWQYRSQLGDNPAYGGTQMLDEGDLIRLNGLLQGQVLNLDLLDSAWVGGPGVPGYVGAEYTVELWRVIEQDTYGTRIAAGGPWERRNINPDATTEDEEVRGDLLLPGMDELAFDGTRFYGYSDVGGEFIAFDPVYYNDSAQALTTLGELNNVVSGGNLLSLDALAGRARDSVWAIGEFQTAAGTVRNSLVAIEKLRNSVHDDEVNNRPTVRVATTDLSQFEQIVGLAELDGVLYGLDGPTRTLFAINGDPTSPTFGTVIAGSTRQIGDDALVPAGLSVSRDGGQLMVLTDRPSLAATDKLADGLYLLDPATGQIDSDPWYEFPTEMERHGLATKVHGDVIVGEPLLGSPVGDTVEITFDDEGPRSHVFGSGQATFSSPGDVVLSDASELAQNFGGSVFNEAGYYYAFDISYTSSRREEFTVTIEDIDWLDGSENAWIASAVADDPASTGLAIQQLADGSSALLITIDPSVGDGDVRVFFGGTSTATVVVPGGSLPLGRLLGQDTREDMTPQRDTVVPGLSDLTIHPWTIAVDYRLDMDQQLEEDLRQVLTEEQMTRLEEDLDGEIINEVVSALLNADAGATLNEFLWSLDQITYDAVGYDADLETFVLVSTTTFDVAPVMVESSVLISDDDPSNDVALTEELLRELFTERQGHMGSYRQELASAAGLDELPAEVEIAFDDIRGLDFGEIDADLPVNELFVVVTVTISDPVSGASVTRDSLLRMDNVLDAAAGMSLAAHDFADAGFEDIRTLAFGNAEGSNATNGQLYGIDAVSDALVRIDWREAVPLTNQNGSKPNVNYGLASPVGDLAGSLGVPSQADFDVQFMDIAPDGLLYGYEATNNSIVQIFTGPSAQAGNRRLELKLPLDDGYAYSALTFSPNMSSTWPGLLVRSVTASPMGDIMTVAVNSGATSTHTLGGADTVANGLTISSAANNASTLQQRAGYYELELEYGLNQGEIRVTLDDVDWINGIDGSIDTVLLSDTLNARVETFTGDSVELIISTNHATMDGGTTDSLTVSFAATSEVVWPASSGRQMSLAGTASGTGEIDTALIVPEDGDYLLRVASDAFMTANRTLNDWLGTPGFFFPDNLQSPLSDYELRLQVFDDGNSDFGPDQSASGIPYAQAMPTNSAVDLGPIAQGNNDLVADADNPNLFRYNPDRLGGQWDPRLDWPIRVTGSLLEPGRAGSLTIDADLGSLGDVDVYKIELTEGQRVTIDIDAASLSGRNYRALFVGIYNGDYEAIASIVDEADDVLSAGQAGQQDDPIYHAQAVFTAPNHEGVVIDPDVNGVGTYYITVVGMGADDQFPTTVNNDPLAYRLHVQTSQPEQVEAAPSQLVWLAFDGARADYLMEDGSFPRQNEVNRPAFDADIWGLGDLRPQLVQEIADRIEQMYRDAGLDTENEIKFVLEQPAAGMTYSTVVFGGKLPMFGLLGIAEKIDRYNADRSDMAAVLTDEAYTFLRSEMSDDTATRFDQVATAIANVGAHELGHILGMEHSTEINTDEPNNMMGYNEYLVPQEFETRNSYALFGGFPYSIELGFQNEVDMLLRYIGSGTPMGI